MAISVIDKVGEVGAVPVMAQPIYEGILGNSYKLPVNAAAQIVSTLREAATCVILSGAKGKYITVSSTGSESVQIAPETPFVGVSMFCTDLVNAPATVDIMYKASSNVVDGYLGFVGKVTATKLPVLGSEAWYGLVMVPNNFLAPILDFYLLLENNAPANLTFKLSIFPGKNYEAPAGGGGV